MTRRSAANYFTNAGRTAIDDPTITEDLGTVTNQTQPQHPSLIVESPLNDGDLWIECRTCSRANYLSKGPISHKRGCATGAQYSATAKTPAAQLDREIAESVRNQELRTFANNVRHTGLTKGRDKDMLDAVRKGFLSVDDAMNTDD
jgi:hypothetical protein